MRKVLQLYSTRTVLSAGYQTLPQAMTCSDLTLAFFRIAVKDLLEREALKIHSKCWHVFFV
jgi:hypothetical protein